MQKIFLGLFIHFFTLIPMLSAIENNKVVAIINSNFVIYNYDIEEQKNYLSLTNPNSNQSFLKDKNINAIILNKLIENHLFNLESKRYGINVNKEDFNKAIIDITKNLQINKEKLYKKALSKGLSNDKLDSLINADILSEKIKQIIAFSRSTPSGEEINQETDKMLNLNGKSELLLYEIAILNINQTSTKQKIQLLKKQLNKKNFESFAKKFSDSINAKQGGLIGWIPFDYIPSNILENVGNLKIGGISQPILVGNYYKIFYLKEARPLITINPSDQSHLKKLTEYAKQKLMYEKSQINLEDFIKEMYQNASIKLYIK